MSKRRDQDVIIGEDTGLSLTEFSLICEVEQHYIIEMVEMGILEPRGRVTQDWHFSSLQLHRFRKARRLQNDLQLNLAGVALGLDLLDELKELRDHIQKLENQIKLISNS